MRKLLGLIIIFLTVSLSGCLNPFYDYAHNYTNVVWESTENSDLDIKIYVIEGNTFSHLVVVNHDEENYYFYGSIDTTLWIESLDEDGCLYPRNPYTIEADGWALNNGVFTAEISKDTIFNYYDSKTIQLAKREIYEEEIKFYMHLNATIKSNDNSFESYSIVNHEEEIYKIAFNTYGTFNINNIEYDIRLKLNVDNTFEIYDLNTDELLFTGYIESNLKEGKFMFNNNVHGIEELEVTIDFM